VAAALVLQQPALLSHVVLLELLAAAVAVAVLVDQLPMYTKSDKCPM
jgi:hypothetical protein